MPGTGQGVTCEMPPAWFGRALHFICLHKNPGGKQAVSEPIPGYPQQGLCRAGIEK